MKRFFSKFGLWLLGALAVITVVLCIISGISSGTGFLRDLGGIIASPFRSAGSAVAGWVQRVGQHFDDLQALQEENEALRQENAKLQDQLRHAEADHTQNETLRRALGLRQQHRDFVLELGRVTDRSANNWTSTLTLNRGTAHGVAIGNCAVDAYGNLAGVVTDAGLNWCTVTTVLDTSSQIGASVFRTGDIAVTRGELGLMNKNRLKLEYLSRDAELLSGDLIVTSGLGGYYPAGLPIGSVVELGTGETGVDQYAVLAPKCDLSRLTEVFLITDFDILE